MGVVDEPDRDGAAEGDLVGHAGVAVVVVDVVVHAEDGVGGAVFGDAAGAGEGEALGVSRFRRRLGGRCIGDRSMGSGGGAKT